ncbi:hypothetical protein BDC45DRAFT_492592 [Circinella umbellata]|nr:hypothetical protein BDC45DRAFT_492592 [Circinella umbellata]
MQTRLGLRTVRKSAHGTDVSHDAPQQAVSPFHPPVKFDEKNLKPAINEERPTKRRSTRLNDDKKDGQRTLFDSFTSVQQQQSGSTTNNKKRTTTTIEPISEEQHQPKKQRVHQKKKEDESVAVEKSQEQQKHSGSKSEAVVINEQPITRSNKIMEAIEQSRKEAPGKKPSSVKTPQVPFNIKLNIKPTTEKTTKSTIHKKLTPPALPKSLALESTKQHKELSKHDDTPLIEEKKSTNIVTTQVKGLNEPAHHVEKKTGVEKAQMHKVSPETNDDNAKSRDDGNTTLTTITGSNSASTTTEETPAWKKSFVFQSDEARVQDEKSTLHKLRNALDMSVMFHAANQRIALFHKIQPMLRNSTKKNITTQHLAKILFVAPKLYSVSPKLLGHNGTQIETYAVELGFDWKSPLSGKQLEQRENILEDRMKSYFIENKGKLAIPEKELPRIEKVVDRKKWIETANLPSGVRDLLQLEERRKEQAEKAKATLPPLTGTGTVKDRRQALLERIRAKSKK